MNIIGSKVDEQELKSKRLMKIIIILIILLLLISIGLGVAIYYLQALNLKVSIDGISMSSVPEDLFVFDEDKQNVYISIKDFARLVGYTPYNGEYQQYSEDTTKCYVQNDSEVASYTLNQKKIYKTLLKEGNDYEYYDLEEPVRMINGKLYTTPEGIQIGCNINFNYSQKDNRITIYTIPYLVNYYASRIKNAAVIDERSDYSNKKAILYNMMIVMNEEKKYGVNALDGKEIIGAKYASIKFVESSREFIVTTDDKKMGIISYDATTKIRPEYDEIKQIDRDLDLYLVTNNKKQGVLNKSGKLIAYLEYDKIGMDISQFPSNNIKNQYLLFDNCIPVQRDKKWGLLDKNGNQILPLEYDTIGCVVGTTKEQSVNNVAIIPEYEGIVVSKDKYYGIFSSIGREIIPCAVQEVYSITNSGQEEYYMTYNQQTVNLKEYLQQTQIETNNNSNNNSNNNTSTNFTNTVTSDNNTSTNSTNIVTSEETTNTLSTGEENNNTTTQTDENATDNRETV